MAKATLLAQLLIRGIQEDGYKSSRGLGYVRVCDDGDRKWLTIDGSMDISDQEYELLLEVIRG